MRTALDIDAMRGPKNMAFFIRLEGVLSCNTDGYMFC
jgi:hypothetical protein